jgi:vacuole morphology and inheritance protein 14
MLLPQSSAFAALKNRLNSVSAIGYLHIAPRAYVSQSRNNNVVEAPFFSINVRKAQRLMRPHLARPPMLARLALIDQAGLKGETTVVSGGMSCLRSLEAFKNELEGHKGQEQIWTMGLVLEMDEVEKGSAQTHSRTWLDYKTLQY